MSVTETPLDYDPFAPEVVADPYPWYRRLRDEAPLYRQEALDFWAVSRYDDVVAGARAHDVLSSAEGVTYTRAPAIPMMLTMDAPDHTRLRRLVSRDFTPRAVAEWRPLVERLTTEAFDRMLDERSVDAVDALAVPLPIQTIATVLGVPAEDHAQFRAWSDQIVEGLALSRPDEFDRADVMMTGILGLKAYTEALVDVRRRAPKDDMLTKLMEPRDGIALSDSELFWFVLLLLVAGNETTTNLLGNLLRTLAEEPDVWTALRARPDLAPSAIEESLRRDSPIQGFFRTALEPFPIAGGEVPAGGRVLLLWGAANRDPRHYDEPDVFRIDRAPTDHLGFGSGIHLCLGAHLARLEGVAVLTQLLQRVERLELDGDPVRGTNPILRGMARLPLTLVPA